MDDRSALSERKKRIFAGLGLTIFFLVLALVVWYAGRPLVRFACQPELFRQWVDSRGLPAHILFACMMALQMVVAIIPSEPFEIAAGYAFGAIEGTILCSLGSTVGSMMVFFLVRRFGTQAIEVFFSLDKLRSLHFLENERRLHFWAFLLYFLPGTPKAILCYFIGLTSMSLKNWVILSTIARLPAILTSTVGGNALGTENYLFAVLVFAGTLLFSGLGLLLYRQISRQRQKNDSSK